jgi:hypothetical protein
MKIAEEDEVLEKKNFDLLNVSKLQVYMEIQLLYIYRERISKRTGV